MAMLMKINPFPLRKTKIVYKFGLFECNRVNDKKTFIMHRPDYTEGVFRHLSLGWLSVYVGKKMH